MDWIDQLPPEMRQFVVQLRALPDFPRHLAKFAQVLHQRQRDHNKLNVELGQRAWALAPHDPHVRVATEWALRRSVPRWHFPMVHDQRRNAVYAQALQQFVSPNMHVLEIGAGSGLLAMLAARAGARHVYTCEMEPLIAAAAQENIVRNGFADRITVIAKKSTDLVVGVDLPERADLLVSEIVDNGLLGEGVLPVIEDARTRLLRPDAPILPAQIALCGVLVGGPRWTEGCRMDEILGLDLSAFNRLAPPIVTPRITEQMLDDALSDEVALVHFDFLAQAQYPKEQRVLTLLARRDGVVHGMLSWLWLGFSDTLQFDNKPPRQSVWHPLLHAFAQPLHVRAGEPVQVTVAHDRSVVIIWPI
jgi:type II protein arginine methyltransferase